MKSNKIDTFVAMTIKGLSQSKRNDNTGKHINLLHKN